MEIAPVLETEEIKKCFRLKDNAISNLNIIFNVPNSMIIFWNKYQIFMYENMDFDGVARTFDPEFYIHDLIVTNSYLLCLDCSGNIHIASLKFKNVALKRLKSSFQQREEKVLAWTRHGEDFVITLKYESDSYFLCAHQLNTTFTVIKKVAIKCNNENWFLPQTSLGKCILKCYIVKENILKNIKELYNLNDDYGLGREHYLIIVTFDKLNIYSCLFSPRLVEEEVILLKLYTCPVEISDIKFLERDYLNALIGLSVGTLIKLALKSGESAKLIHFNTAIYKFVAITTTIIYTDGLSMWRTDNTYSSEKIKFSQYFVKQVKDFIIFGDQILCTTFSDFIYMFPMDDDSSYVKPITIHNYTSVNRLTNSGYLHKILEEMDINEKVVKKVCEENYYVTALSLSNRRDIMDNVIKHQIKVYDNYEDVLKENTKLMLTNEIKDYFIIGSFYFLTQIRISEPQNVFNEVLSSLLEDLKIHITIATELKTLKTTTVRVVDMKRINILIPMEAEMLSKSCQINVQMKIVSNIPAAFNIRQSVWLLLYQNNTILNCENFIKPYSETKNITFLKSPQESIEELICKTAQNQYGNLFKFTNILQCKTEAAEWSLYIKLPKNYKEVFKREEKYKKYFNPRKANFMFQRFSSEDFLNGKIKLTLEIFNINISFEVIKDLYTFSQLKISCENMQYTFSMRYFFSNFINDHGFNFKPGRKFVAHSYYTVVENVQKALQSCVDDRLPINIFLPLAEQFEKCVMGCLPL